MVVIEPTVDDPFSEAVRLRSVLEGLKVPIDVIVFGQEEARRRSAVRATVVERGLCGHTSARGGGLAVAVGRRTASVAWVSSTAKRSQSPRAACAGSDRAYPAQRGRGVDRPCARCFAWGRLASRRWRRTRALRRCRSKGVQSWC